MRKLWGNFIEILSGEWVLTKCKASNGGSIIVFRALFSSTILFFVVLGIINLVDPTRTLDFSWFELRKQIVEKITWYGVIFVLAMIKPIYKMLK